MKTFTNIQRYTVLLCIVALMLPFYVKAQSPPGPTPAVISGDQIIYGNAAVSPIAFTSPPRKNGFYGYYEWQKSIDGQTWETIYQDANQAFVPYLESQITYFRHVVKQNYSTYFSSNVVVKRRVKGPCIKSIESITGLSPSTSKVISYRGSLLSFNVLFILGANCTNNNNSNNFEQADVKLFSSVYGYLPITVTNSSDPYSVNIQVQYPHHRATVDVSDILVVREEKSGFSQSYQIVHQKAPKPPTSAVISGDQTVLMNTQHSGVSIVTPATKGEYSNAKMMWQVSYDGQGWSTTGDNPEWDIRPGTSWNTIYYRYAVEYLAPSGSKEYISSNVVTINVINAPCITDISTTSLRDTLIYYGKSLEFIVSQSSGSTCNSDLDKAKFRATSNVYGELGLKLRQNMAGYIDVQYPANQTSAVINDVLTIREENGGYSQSFNVVQHRTPAPAVISGDQTNIYCFSQPTAIDIVTPAYPGGTQCYKEWQVSSDKQSWSKASEDIGYPFMPTLYNGPSVHYYRHAIRYSGSNGIEYQYSNIATVVTETAPVISNITSNLPTLVSYKGEDIIFQFQLSSCSSSSPSRDNVTITSSIHGELSWYYPLAGMLRYPHNETGSKIYDVLTIREIKTGYTQNFNLIQEACPSVPVSTLLSGDQAIYVGKEAAPITFVSQGSMADNYATPHWEKSIDGQTWEIIATNPKEPYSPGKLTQTTYYRHVLIQNFNSEQRRYYSNIVTVTVLPAPCISGAGTVYTQKMIPYQGQEIVISFGFSYTNHKNCENDLSNATVKIISNKYGELPIEYKGDTYIKIMYPSNYGNYKKIRDILIVEEEKSGFNKSFEVIQEQDITILAPAVIGEDQDLDIREVAEVEPVVIRTHSTTNCGNSGNEWQYSIDNGTIWNVANWSNAANNLECDPGVLQKHTLVRYKSYCENDHDNAVYSNIVTITISKKDIALDVDQNYILSYTPTNAYSNIEDKSHRKLKPEIIYYDGLGRPMQQIASYSSPNSKDLVTPISYDVLGRQDKDILPYMADGSNGSYRGDNNTSQVSFYNSLYPEEGSYATNRRHYETSPLSRVKRSHLPGNGGYETVGRSIQHNYYVNKNGEALQWVIEDDNTLSTTTYAVGTLYVEETVDPDGRIIRIYTDKRGRTIEIKMLNLERTIAMVTSYVYDERGLLRCVIPPKAKDYTINSSEFNALIFRYDYDHRDRCIVKKVPDADPVYFVYDKLDRLVMYQDGNMRVASKWMVKLYDNFDREVVGGLLTCSISHAALQAYYKKAIVNQVRSGTNYTLNSIVGVPAISENDILSCTFYDNYIGLADYSASKFADVAPQKIDKPKGLVVGTKAKVLDGNEHTSSAKWLTSVTYYDNMYRPIQTVRDLYDGTVGGKAFISTNFTFDGRPEKAREVQNFNGTTTTITQRYKYDQTGRPTRIYHQIDGEAEVLISETTYDALGRAQTKKIGSTEIVNYAYNIRGWLTKIESSNFKSDIFYHASNSGLGIPEGTVPRWNGNIAAIGMQNGKNYKYTYDGFDRLLSGIHTDGYDEKVGSYDANGNILSLIRTGGANAADYRYNYSGNRLSSLQNGGEIYAYGYDNNGNNITDGLRGVSITYNVLNLPKSISKKDQNFDYIYDTSGNKLAKRYCGAYSQFYAGSIVYTGNKTIEHIAHGEGLAVKINGGFNYQYNLPDHLGNIRAVISNGAAIQQTNYYPFGTAHILESIDKNKYLYGGKELQAEEIGESQFIQYDFGARFYDPLTGRWGTPDPLTEKFYNVSSFAYCNNNPILNFDPNGMYWLTTRDQQYATDLIHSINFPITAKTVAISLNEQSITQKKLRGKSTLDEELAIANYREEIRLLRSSQAELTEMGSDPDQGFTFVQLGEDEEMGGTQRRSDGVIEMSVTSKANAIHEAVHAYDIWKEGPTTAFNMIGRERKAYSRQLAYDASSMPKSSVGGFPKKLSDITDNWVKGITTSEGDYHYIRFLFEGQGQTYTHSIGVNWVKATNKALKQENR